MSLVVLLTGCSSKKDETTIVEFDLTNTADQTLFISSGADDFRYIRQFGSNDSSANFVDTLEFEKGGLFTFSLNQTAIDLYIEKGADLQISTNAEDLVNTIRFEGDLANENNYLVSRRKLSEKNLHELNEQDFILELDQYEEDLLTLLRTSNTSGKFREQEEKEITYEVVTSRLLYPEIHRRITGDETFKVGPDFFNGIHEINFRDTLAYVGSQTNAYPSMVTFYFEKIARDNQGRYNGDELFAYIAEVDKAFPKGSVKDGLLLRKLYGGMKMNENMDEVYEIYKGALQNEEYLQMATQEYNQLKKLEPGNPAPDFDLENFLGGQTQLKELKGKIVYIDVWATWCGPCIAEFPAVKEAAEEFPDIQFVSISIDMKNHFEKWKKAVERENLPGIQLIAYRENETFKNNYAIRSIPRYVLIDKEGDIVSANTYRPSDPKLGALFRSLL